MISYQYILKLNIIASSLYKVNINKVSITQKKLDFHHMCRIFLKRLSLVVYKHYHDKNLGKTNV